MGKKTKRSETGESSPNAVLYVCVKQRGKNESSCGGRNSRDLLDKLRERAAGATEVEVRACGCLDLCSQGPIVVLANAPAANSKKPPKPKKLLTKKGGAGEVFTQVEEAEIDKLLRHAQQHQTRF